MLRLTLSSLVLAMMIAACSTPNDATAPRASGGEDAGADPPAVTEDAGPLDGGARDAAPEAALAGPRAGLLDEVCDDWAQEVSATGARVFGSRAPLVSPDGKRIAYARCVGGGSPELVIRDVVEDTTTSLGAFPAHASETESCGWARATPDGIVFLAGGDTVRVVDWSGVTKASLPVSVGYYEARLGVRVTGGVLSVAKLVKSATGTRLALYRSNLPAPHSVTSQDLTPALGFDPSTEVGVADDGARAFLFSNVAGQDSELYVGSAADGAPAAHVALEDPMFVSAGVAGGALATNGGVLRFISFPSGDATRLSGVGSQASRVVIRNGEVWFVELGSQYLVRRWTPGSASPTTVSSTPAVGLAGPSQGEALTDDKAFFLSSLTSGVQSHVLVTRVATGLVRTLPAAQWRRGPGATLVWSDIRDAAQPKLHFSDLESGVDRTIDETLQNRGSLEGVTADGRALVESYDEPRKVHLVTAAGATKVVFTQPMDRSIRASVPVAADAVVFVTASGTPSRAKPRELYLYR